MSGASEWRSNRIRKEAWSAVVPTIDQLLASCKGYNCSSNDSVALMGWRGVGEEGGEGKSEDEDEGKSEDEDEGKSEDED